MAIERRAQAVIIKSAPPCVRPHSRHWACRGPAHAHAGVRQPAAKANQQRRTARTGRNTA
eukprot:5268615-Pleurochrysis_carterae.AAC.2